jgi:hypothetical protein
MFDFFHSFVAGAVTKYEPLHVAKEDSTALPKNVQKQLDKSKEVINTLGSHKLTQLDEALNALKMNQAPSLVRTSRFDMLDYKPYEIATMALKDPVNLKKIDKSLNLAVRHSQRLHAKSHPGATEASQRKHDLDMAASWTREGSSPHENLYLPFEPKMNALKKNDPHKIFTKHAPTNEEDRIQWEAQKQFRTNKKGIEARRRYDPEYREAAIEALDKEYEQIIIMLDRNKLPTKRPSFLQRLIKKSGAAD